MLDSLPIETVIAAISVVGSFAVGAVSFLMLRGTKPKKPKRTVEDIVRTAPYEGLDNILKVAKS